MSDDNNDFDSDDFDLEGFDDGFDKNENTLADLWRNNAFVKIGVILIGIAFVVIIIMIFSGDKDKSSRSSISRGSEITETPGSGEISDTMKMAIEEDNTKRLEAALRENESVMPLPVNTSKGQIPFDMEKPDEEDPLERWKRLQEEKVQRAERKPEPEPEEPEVDTRTPAIEALAEAMSQQMESILNNQEINGANIKQVAGLEYLESLTKKERELLEKERERLREEQEDSLLDDSSETILLPAGTIEYAQLITEANTDVPGPILAQIVTGPFKGGRLIGTFDQTYDYLTLNFDTIVLDGVDYSAEAVAIDPDTTLPGVISEIDRRYFMRVVLPVAAEFISGFTQAISESGSTTITVSGETTTSVQDNDKDSDQEVASGIATAGAELSGIIKEIKDNHPPMLRVRAGTPLGVLFVDAVTDGEEESSGQVLAPQNALRSFQSGASQ